MSKAVNVIAGVVLIIAGLIPPGNPNLIYIGISMLASSAAAALQKKPKVGRGEGLELNYAGTIEPRRILYGTLKIGGMHNIPPMTTGASNEMGHADIIVAGHEVADITDVYLDNDLIASADIGSITGSTNDGAVTTGKFANHAWIRRYKGTSTQAADYILANSVALGNDFRLRGNAHVAVQLKFNPEIFPNWPQITVIGQGQKVYDPRLDSTKPGGSGTHREDDETTWAHSACPPLLIRHFLVHEVGFSHEEMNDSLIQTAANTCDTAVNIPGSLTQKRWTCNILLKATDPWEDNLRLLVESMEGHVAYIDGVWLIYAGEWQTPDVTIGAGDWVSPIQVRASVNRDERWNFVRGWYVDPNRNWQRMECYPRRSTTYESADGGERIPVEIEMPYCASSVGDKYAEYEAQRHAEIQLRKSRNQIMVTGTLRPEFAKLIPGNTVQVNDSVYGWTNKTFRIVSVETGILQEGGVNVALTEEESTLWTDLTAGEYSTESVLSNLSGGATLPTLTADPTVLIGPSTISFNIAAGVPSTQPLGTQYVVIENANSNYPPTSGYGVEVWRGTAPSAVIIRSTPTTAWYWMQAQVGTYKSGFRPTSDGIPVAPLSYGPQGLTITRQPSNVDDQLISPITHRVPGNVLVSSPYFEYSGANGTVTFSWQVSTVGREWTGTGTPNPLHAHSAIYPGSQHPYFFMPHTLASGNGLKSYAKVTIKDNSYTLTSNTFYLHSSFISLG